MANDTLGNVGKSANYKYLVLLLSFATQAKFHSLLEEFLRSHLKLKVHRVEQSQANIRRDILLGTKTWRLIGNYTYIEEDPYIHSIGFSRDFSWGGQIQFNHSLFLDRSKRSLNWSQDIGRNFFGQQFSNTLAAAQENIFLSQLTLSQRDQQELDHFYQSYLQARLQRTLLQLQQQSLQRSQQRLDITRKRVRDGLNEQIDLYSAHIELTKKKEELNTAQLLQKKSIRQTLSPVRAQGICYRGHPYLIKGRKTYPSNRAFHP